MIDTSRRLDRLDRVVDLLAADEGSSTTHADDITGIRQLSDKADP